MKTIRKYELEITGEQQEAELPVGAEILTVQTQNENPCIWAMVNPDAEKEIRRFTIFGTGHPIDHDGRRGMNNTTDSLKYIGTYQTFALMFHVFECISKGPSIKHL